MNGQDLATVWSVFSIIGGALVLIVSVVKGVEYLFKLMPVSKLEERVKSIEEHDKNDFEHFKEIERRIEHIEQKLSDSDDKMNQIAEGINRLGKSQILLLRHFVTGNGQKEMTKEADDLTEFFIDRNGIGGKHG